MGEMKQKHLDPLESGPHRFQPQANSIIWVAQIYTATRSGLIMDQVIKWVPQYD